MAAGNEWDCSEFPALREGFLQQPSRSDHSALLRLRKENLPENEGCGHFSSILASLSTLWAELHSCPAKDLSGTEGFCVKQPS